MKTISAFLLIMLVCAINSNLENFPTQECLDHVPPFLSIGKANNQAYSLDFCRSTKYNTYDYAQCCFIKWKRANTKARQYHCLPVTVAQLNNIDDLIDGFESITNVVDEVDSLDCSSSYLYGSLLLIASLLF